MAYSLVVTFYLYKVMKIVYFVLFHTVCIILKGKMSKISLRTDNKITSEGEHCKDFVVNRCVIDYENFLSRDEEYDGSVEFTCITRLFSNYLFRAHNEKKYQYH